MSVSLDGKVILITVGGSEIGRAAAAALAKMGAYTVLLCRNRERGKSRQRI